MTELTQQQMFDAVRESDETIQKLQTENAELKRLLQSAYDVCEYLTACKQCMGLSCEECLYHFEDCSYNTWHWKYADEVKRILEGDSP